MKFAVVGILFGTGCWIFAQDKAPESSEQALITSLNGQVLYQNYCATCHGTDAKGNGPMAPVLKTPPPDLTQIAVRNGGVFPQKNVEKIII